MDGSGKENEKGRRRGKKEGRAMEKEEEKVGKQAVVLLSFQPTTTTACLVCARPLDVRLLTNLHTVRAKKVEKTILY
uniref:Uncharacterized protein n=1 Tax=Caenorhabditis japonica TaxID=281687 RepID=A0A8R1ILA3_CAEJA